MARRRVTKSVAKSSRPAISNAPVRTESTITHTEHEDYPWTINIPDHVARSDSREYTASRKAMNATADRVAGFFYGPPPYQDHHGGGLWLKDEGGWFLVRNLAGMEWSSQFCADPQRVDMLRQNAQRLYAAFPEAVALLGIADLLAKPIKTAADVSAWTDSICNASVPLTAPKHTGVLPTAGGIHHYPAPIAEIDFFKFPDFNLWVIDETGQPAAVAPVSPRGSGDGRVRVLWTAPGTPLHTAHAQAQRQGDDHILPADHPLAEQAFREQVTHSPEPPVAVGRQAVRTR